MMWILFAIRRRQRMKGIEQDTVVQAAVAAAGLNRTPLDDDDDDSSPISPNTYYQSSSGMGQRSTLLGRGSDSLPTSARLSEVLDDFARDSANSYPGRPVEPRASSHPEGYIQARTTSPSPRAEQCTDDPGSSRDRKSSYGHTPTYSAGSFEPLLANYVQNMSDQDASALAMEPPRNRPRQHLGSGLAPNGDSSDGSPVDGSRRTSVKRHNSSDSSVLRDEEDYTRLVLTASIRYTLHRGMLNLISRFAMCLIIKVNTHYNECSSLGVYLCCYAFFGPKTTPIPRRTLHVDILVRYHAERIPNRYLHCRIDSPTCISSSRTLIGLAMGDGYN